MADQIRRQGKYGSYRWAIVPVGAPAPGYMTKSITIPKGCIIKNVWFSGYCTVITAPVLNPADWQFPDNLTESCFLDWFSSAGAVPVYCNLYTLVRESRVSTDASSFSNFVPLYQYFKTPPISENYTPGNILRMTLLRPTGGASYYFHIVVEFEDINANEFTRPKTV